MVPKKIGADHAQLMWQLLGIGKRLEALATAASGHAHEVYSQRAGKEFEYDLKTDAGIAAAMDELVSLVTDLGSVCLDHFEEEEVVLGTMMRKYFTKAQYDAITADLSSREMAHGLRGLAWLLRTAGHGPSVLELRRQIPCHLLLLHDCCSMPSYLNHERRWIESVYDPSVPRP